MNEIDGIKPHEFMGPTGLNRQWVDSNDLRQVIMARLEGQQSGRSKGLFGAKAGAAMRADRLNTHLSVLADLMSGEPVSINLTEGDSLSVHFGGRRIHIPTFNERTLTAVQAGVRYAPLQQAVWDPGTKSTRVISAQESLTNTLQGLLRSGIKDQPIAEQASAIADALENFRATSMLHLRFGPQAVGGALPYYLSKHVAINESHPAVAAARKGEAFLSAAVKSIGMKSDVVLGKGTLGTHGMHESQSHIRNALAHQLAVGLMTFEEGSPFKSTGVKTLKLRGISAFSEGREVGGTGRLIASTLPAWGYGIATPGSQLAKGIHHRRQLMAMPRNTINEIRTDGARIRGLKSPYRSGKLLSSSFDIEAQSVAAQAYAQSGAKLTGEIAQTEHAIRGGFLRIKPGISEADQELGRLAQTMLFGDSTMLASSPEMTRMAGETRRFMATRTVSLAHSRGGAGYATADLHPVLAKAIEEGGVGGPIALDTPITFEMLGGTKKKARIGGALSSTGEVRASRRGKVIGEYLKHDEEITGFRTGPGGTQAVIRKRGEMAMQAGTPVLVGRKRLSLGGGVRSFRGFDVIGPAGGMGFDLSSPDALLEHISRVVEKKSGRTGVHDIATALGGKFKENLGTIDYGDAELFPAGTDGKRNLHKLRSVIEVAEKHGITIGPGSETERRALLSDIFDKGEVGKIEQLWRGHSIGQHEAGLMSRAGPVLERALAARGKRLSDVLDIVGAHTNVGFRAGQPSRGQFGRIAVRMRDLRMYAVGVASTTGSDILSMYRKNEVLKTKFGFTGPKADQAARGMRRYGQMWRNHVERPTGLTQYLDAITAAAEGRLNQLPGGEFEVISHEEYKRRFGSGVNQVRRRSELKNLVGTPYVEEIDGQLRPTRKTLIVEMAEVGGMSQRRQLNTHAVTMQHVVVPSGEALGLRRGEYINFEKLKGRGLKSSFGRSAVQLHGALVGGDAMAAYKVGGATGLTGFEHYFGRGGQGHRGAGIGVHASFSGTLVSDANLDVGDVGVSRKTAREMLKRQGWKGPELEAQLTAIESGKAEHFTHFKTEPMRGAEHITQARMKIRPSGTRTGGVGGEMLIHNDDAIFANPLGLLRRERDYDYDPGYLWNFAKKSKKGALSNYNIEQTAMKVLWEKNRAEHKAVTEVAQQIVARMPSADKMQVTSAEMIVRAREIAKQFMGREVVEGAHTVEYAMAQAMAAVPELLTPMANVRHRTRMQILEDIALGKDIDSMVTKAHASTSRGMLMDAMSMLRGDQPAIAWLHSAAKASEYSVLKKLHAEMALRGGTEVTMAGAPDLFFHALASDLRIGQARPGTAAAEIEISHLMEPLMALMGTDEGRGAQVAGMLPGPGGESLGVEAVSRRMATSYQAVSFLERSGAQSTWQAFLTDPRYAGTSIGTQGAVSQYVHHLQGRDAEFAGPLLSGGQNWGAIQAGTAVGAGAAGEEALRHPTPGMGGWGKAFAEGSSKALRGLWESKWGKWGIGGAGVLMAISAGRSLFGSGGGDSSPPGAPMPPPPLLDGLGPERELDYNGFGNSEARVQRVPQVRTHYQVTGTTSNGSDFRGLGDGALGGFGRRPTHSGTFSNQTTRQTTRNRTEAEVNDRMYADF